MKSFFFFSPPLCFSKISFSSWLNILYKILYPFLFEREKKGFVYQRKTFLLYFTVTSLAFWRWRRWIYFSSPANLMCKSIIWIAFAFIRWAPVCKMSVCACVRISLRWKGEQIRLCFEYFLTAGDTYREMTKMQSNVCDERTQNLFGRFIAPSELV